MSGDTAPYVREHRVHGIVSDDEADPDVIEARINAVLEAGGMGTFIVSKRQLSYDRSGRRVIHFILPYESMQATNHDRLYDIIGRAMPYPPYLLIETEARFEAKSSGLVADVVHKKTLAVKYTSLVVSASSCKNIFKTILWAGVIVFVLYTVWQYLDSRDRPDPVY